MTEHLVRDAPRGLGAATVCEAFQIAVADQPDKVAVRTPGDEFSMTWTEYGERVARTAAGLAALGVTRGDTVGLMLTNRPEFHWVDTAAMHIGAIAFSIYNTSAEDQIEYLLRDAANRVMVCEAAFLERVLAVRERVATLEHVVVVGDAGAVDGTLTLSELDAAGDSAFDFEAAWRDVAPENLLTLIYTSGTTGPPKGVELTHANQMATISGGSQRLEWGSGSVVSYLPLAHIAERWWGYYQAICLGDTVTCVADPAALLPAMLDARPTRFLGVPRIWEKFKAALEAGLAAEPDEQRRAAVARALELGRLVIGAEQTGTELSAELAGEHELAEAQVLSKLRAKLGLDRLDLAGVGAAPTPLEVLEFFTALGVPLVEGWAMSETAAGGIFNPLHGRKLGTVGKPLPGCEIKLAPDGELLFRGPTVMRGYRNQPEKTAETIDAEGWLHTGDVAQIDADGYVTIVDRKKELIINSAGKNMSPANIEARIKSSSPVIGQAVCIGDARPYNVALITLDPDGAAGREADDPEIRAAVRDGVERANAQLSRVEQIKKFKLLETEWLPGGDELTPTMKLKRKPIEQKYAAEIEALYAP